MSWAGEKLSDEKITLLYKDALASSVHQVSFTGTEKTESGISTTWTRDKPMLSAPSFLLLALTTVPTCCSMEMSVIYHVKQEEVLSDPIGE